MACCGMQGNADKERRLPFPVALFVLAFLAVLAAGSLLAVALLIPFSREARSQWTPLGRGILAFISSSFSRSLDQPFLVHRSVRCRLSGRLYPASGLLAGWTYRYFNLVVLGLVASLAACVALAARFMGE